MKTHTAPSGNVYTATTVTINGKVFKLKRTRLEWDLTKTFNDDQRNRNSTTKQST